MNTTATLGITQLCLILPLALILGWTYGYNSNGGGLGREGVNLFFWHPVLMYLAYGLMMGEALISWRTLNFHRSTLKNIHGALQTVSTLCGITGLVVVFKFHSDIKAPDLYSVHSWIGLFTAIFATLQWLLSVFIFWIPNLASPSLKARVMPLHKAGGKIVFGMGISAMATGIMQRQSFLRGSTEKFDGVNVYGNVLGVVVVLCCASVFWLLDSLPLTKGS